MFQKIFHIKKNAFLLCSIAFFACEQTPKTMADLVDFSKVKSIKYSNKTFPETNIIEKITDITTDTAFINDFKNAEAKVGPYKYAKGGRLIIEYQNGQSIDFQTNIGGELFARDGKFFISENGLLEKYQEKR